MLGQVASYLSVGVLNTLLGLAVIWGLMLLSVEPVPANLAGYAAGLAVAFSLNRAWTFRVGFERGQVLRYVAAFLISYGLNLLVLRVGIDLLRLDGFLAQLPALAVYTVCFFLLSKYFVFR